LGNLGLQQKDGVNKNTRSKPVDFVCALLSRNPWFAGDISKNLHSAFRNSWSWSEHFFWLVVEPYPSEKYEFVNGKDDIPYMKWKIKNAPNHQPVFE